MKTYRSNSKEVSEKVKQHVLDHYDNDIKALKADTNACGSAKAMVEGGNFDIYYDEQRAFLDSLHLNNNSNKEFTDQDVFNMYVLLVSRAIESLTK